MPARLAEPSGKSDMIARVDSALLRAVRENRPEFRKTPTATLLRHALQTLLGNPAGDRANTPDVS
jgi:hypothetical protein